MRAGKPDKAIEQFARIADGLAAEGFLPKAAAVYKKILKLRPDDEHALLQGAGIATQLGLLADARSYLKTVVERRRARGDDARRLQAEMRLGTLDPTDYSGRIAAARARARMGDASGAAADLKTVAGQLADKGRADEAIAALRAAAEFAPPTPGCAPSCCARIWRRAMPPARASGRRPRPTTATSPPLSSSEGARPTGRGPAARARAIPCRRAAPGGPGADTARGGEPASGGGVPGRRECRSCDRIAIAEVHVVAGRIDDASGLLRSVLESDPLRRDDVAGLAWRAAPSVARHHVLDYELAATIAIEQGDFNWAALALQEFVRRNTGHIPALLRLVEVCVDGSLNRTTPAAQAQLADAYFDAGAAAEARVIAEESGEPPSNERPQHQAPSAGVQGVRRCPTRRPPSRSS